MTEIDMEHGVVIGCENCGKVLSRTLRVLQQEEWANWAADFSGEVIPKPYGAMPLVPFGAVTQFGNTTFPVRWGDHTILEKGAFGGSSPRDVLFFAPYDLDLTLGIYMTDCCGPSAYSTGEDWQYAENLFCECGEAIGWIEETCFRHVNFTRVRADRINIAEAPTLWPPALTSGPFDAELLEIARQSEMDAPTDGWRLWEAIQILDQTCALPCGPYHWTNIAPSSDGLSSTIRVYKGPQGPEESSEPYRLVDARTWAEHMRLAASIAMNMVANTKRGISTAST